MMTVEEKKKLENIERDVHEIKSALIGNSLIGDKGLTGQMIAFKEKQIEIEKKVETLIEERVKNTVYIKIINWLGGTIIAGIIALLFNLLKK